MLSVKTKIVSAIIVVIAVMGSVVIGSTIVNTIDGFANTKSTTEPTITHVASDVTDMIVADYPGKTINNVEIVEVKADDNYNGGTCALVKFTIDDSVQYAAYGVSTTV